MPLMFQNTTSGANLQLMALTLTQILSTLFTHVPTSSMVAALVEALGGATAQLLSAAGSRGGSGSKMLSSQVLQKVSFVRK